MKISVITPSYNSANTIETAIKSVLAQDYKNYEHIVVDGASTDGTLDILKRHPHLTWISEPDRGQVHAMNKGFAMATGDIIVNLNADDQFLQGAFSAVLHISKGRKDGRGEGPRPFTKARRNPRMDKRRKDGLPLSHQTLGAQCFLCQPGGLLLSSGNPGTSLLSGGIRHQNMISNST